MNKKDIETIYPLSPQQQGMLYESVYASEMGIQGAHIEQFTFVLRGELDPNLFKQAWQAVIDRHAILRTAFVWQDQEEPLQVVLKKVETPFDHEDWRGFSKAEQKSRLQAYLAADRQKGFHLTKAPLIRAAIFRTAEDRYQLAWTFHHILLDGWCQPLLIGEVASNYFHLSHGRSLNLSPAPAYQDYIVWLRKQNLADTERFWQEKLRNFVEPTPLGSAAKWEPATELAEPYGYRFATLAADTTQRLKTLTRQNHLTLNTIVQGVWAILLSQYSQKENVVFGITTSGRPPNLPNVESMLGLFINSLPLRVQVSPQEQLQAWLKTLQMDQLDLQHYGYCSAGQIHGWSEVPGALPLYESLLVFENYPELSGAQSSNLAFEIDDTQIIGAQTNYPLTLLVIVGTEIEFQLVYQRHRLRDEDVVNILTHYTDLLEAILVEPDGSLAALQARIPSAQIPQVHSAAQIARPTEAIDYVAPRTPTEQTLAAIWSDMLGVGQVGIYHHFFSVGGYSLLVGQVLTRIQQAFQVEISLRTFFEAPTIAELAVVIAQEQAKLVDTSTLEELLSELENMPTG